MMDSSAGLQPTGQPLSPIVPGRQDARATTSQIPRRFQPSKSTLLIDRFMTHFIKVGGASIIAAVLGIFVFIFWQILPLFRGAKVTESKVVSLPEKNYRIIGVDEWTEYPFLMDSDGTLTFVDLMGKRGIKTYDPGYSARKRFSAFRYRPEKQGVAVGTSDGFFSIVDIRYDTTFSKTGRVVMQHAKAGPFFRIGKEAFPVTALDFGGSGEAKLVIGIQDVGRRPEVHVATLLQTTSLLGPGEIMQGPEYDLTASIEGEPKQVAVNEQGTDLLVANDRGDVFYFTKQVDGIKLLQQFQPFEDQRNTSIDLMQFILGGVSVVFTNPDGINRIFSLYQKEGGDFRTFGLIHEMESLPGSGISFDFSLRNKAFLIAGESYASLRHSTTESIRWQTHLPFRVKDAILGGKYKSIVLLDQNNKLHIYELHDPHPESNFHSLFGKIWYEGASKPDYSWQSTGGTDDFEPKLSLTPLIIGTLKGTLYALIFAVPIALLAAVYTSQFLHPDFRVFVKPTMEIMASLPSVVLGFLAALWLAPFVETRVPSILILVAALPLSAFLFGWIWNSLPIEFRVRVKPGFEWIVFIPVMLIVGYLSWILGPALERALFVVKDPNTGARVADFRLWWPHVTGLPFEQRNSLVVGFIMGFAVIPIIFTIAEDAMSNVPGALRSGSLALGASRWQTAMRIVLPTASAGIFSAIMIGLGRAVGETMIVVMATGNTPILNFNIFSGMRTLSANIAVELPEAPYQGTLYRTLFLGGMVLFVMTFFVNTLAEILRQHLREKYKTI